MKDTQYTKSEVDVFAIYVSDLRECFYLKNDILDTNKYRFNLRVSEPNMARTKSMNFAEDYREFPGVAQW